MSALVLVDEARKQLITIKGCHDKNFVSLKD
jgi:hypothetical protein